MSPHPNLQNNRWQAQENEFATYLTIDQLQGIFRKALHIPPAARAYILQNGNSTEVPPGEYELEGFFTRLNNLLRDQQADILIARQSPYPLSFHFTDIHSAEYLPLEISFNLSISLGQISAFARYFMTAPGSITREQLQQLLAPSLRQICTEFLGAQTLHDMLANPHLRLQLDERLQSALTIQIAQFGLNLVQVETLQLQHHKLNQHRQQSGKISLLLEEQRAQQQQQELQQLYDAEEWQKIEQQREQIERDLQQQQMQTQARHDAALLNAEQQLLQDEKLAALRARKIELYARIAAADNQQQAIAQGAKEALRALQHEQAGKAIARLETVDGWRQMRALAEIRMQAELEIATQQARENLALMKQRFALNLARLQREQQSTLLAEIDDKQAQQRASRQAAYEQACARQLQQAEQQARLALLHMAQASRKQEAQRIANWQQQIELHKQRALLRVDALRNAETQVNLSQLQAQAAVSERETEAANSQLQHEKLRATLALQAQFNQQQQALRQQQQEALLDQQERSMQIAQQAAEQEWQRQQQAQAQEHQARVAQWQQEQQHALELARLEMTRIGLIGNLSDTAKLSVVPAENASLLAEVLKTQIHAGMQAEQILASQGGINPQQAAQQIEQERAWREQLAEKERQQQLDLLRIQQGQAAPQYRLCLHGHQNPLQARFCSQCGGALL